METMRAYGRSVRRFLRPLLSLAVSIPILTVACAQSIGWIGSAFPGFFLMNNAVVPTVSGYDWPEERTLLFHSRVRAVDDRPVEGSADAYRIVAARPPGTNFVFEFEKDGEVFRRTIASRTFGAGDFFQTYGILLVFGIISLGAGVVVGFLQPETRQARVYHLQAVVVGLYAVTGTMLYPPGWTVLTCLYFVLESFVGATFMHLALRFPVERDLGVARRAVLLALYVFAVVQTILVLRGFYANPPDLAPIHRNYLVNAGSFVFFLASLAYAYWENAAPLARSRVQALFPGILFGTLAMFYAFVNNAASGGDFPMQFGVLFVPILYVSVAWAIARHDLFDVDRFVRQGVVYAALSVLLVGAYAAVLSLFTWIAPGSSDQHGSVLAVAFILSLALVIDPLRRLLQRLIDAAFYRSRLSYRSTVSQLSDVLPTLLDIREIAEQLTYVLIDSMQLESAAVCTFDDSGNATLWRGADPGGSLQPVEGGPELTQLRDRVGARAGLWPRPGSRNAPYELASEPVRLTDELTAQGFAAVLPLVVSGRTVGLALLGPRRSRRAFNADDVDLLRTLGSQAAIALQNASSYRELQDLTRTLDERVQRQTQELRESHDALERAYADLKSAQAQVVQSEKMASLGQLVAGVAHELNNPVSFVHGSMENLKEFFIDYRRVVESLDKLAVDVGAADRAAELRRELDVEFLNRETPELLASCTEGSERIKRIVDDLRTFARIDRGGAVDLDLREGLESTLRLLDPRIRQAAVRVVRDYADTPPIHANPGRLNQVWMNLLTNALDAVEDRAGGAIELRVRSLPNDHAQVEVVVRDNGRGIPEDIQGRVFEPFFTTKPVGAGTGLGLSIAYGVVREFGGSIDLDTSLVGGTAVRVVLPVAGAPWRPVEG